MNSRPIFILFLFLFQITGCLNPFAPSVVDALSGSGGLITAQRSPDEVLQNFQYAYRFRDSLIYADILDSAYFFRTWDYEQSPPAPVEWNKDTETRITGKMFRAFRKLDLVWNRTIYQDTLNTDLIEMRKSFTLTIDDGIQIPVLNGEVIFRFVRRHEKWYLIYWEDLKI